jgi:hypothetical protein
MNDQDMARFEKQAAETLGAMKELFEEFAKRLGEVVSMQRLAASEARNEGAKARAALEQIARYAEDTATYQRQAIAELRSGWQMHVAENSKAAGAEMARTFGSQIAAGLQQRLENLGADVHRVTRRFEWMSALKWGLGGMAVSFVVLSLAATIMIKAIEPEVDGLTNLQVREAVARLAPCQIDRETHVCTVLDDKPRVGKGPHGEGLVVLKGM